MIIDVILAMMRCPHRCDFAFNLMHFWIKMFIFILGHYNHLIIGGCFSFVGFSVQAEATLNFSCPQTEQFKLRLLRRETPDFSRLYFGSMSFFKHHHLSIPFFTSTNLSMDFLKLWLILLAWLNKFLPCLNKFLPCLNKFLPRLMILPACLNKFLRQHCNLLLSKHLKPFKPYLSFVFGLCPIDAINSFLIIVTMLKEYFVMAMNCHS